MYLTCQKKKTPHGSLNASSGRLFCPLDDDLSIPQWIPLETLNHEERETVRLHQTEFKWKADDGSFVVSVNIPKRSLYYVE